MSEQRVVLPGQRLRAEREARGMSEEEAARHLNLTVSYLTALEADDYERLPEPTFVKGYIRNYARLLELPSEDLANTFEEVLDEEDSAEKQAHLDEVVRPRRRRSGVLLALAGVVLVLAALLFWWLSEPADAPAEPANEPATPEMPAEPAGPPEPVGPAKPDQAEGPSGAEDETRDAGAGPSAGEQVSSAVAEPPPADDELVMSFSDSCWVQVTDAEGQVLFSGQKPAGGRLSLAGGAPFELKIGNAAAVALVTVNGEAVEMPSDSPGDVVRLTVP